MYVGGGGGCALFMNTGYQRVISQGGTGAGNGSYYMEDGGVVTDPDADSSYYNNGVNYQCFGGGGGAVIGKNTTTHTCGAGRQGGFCIRFNSSSTQ